MGARRWTTVALALAAVLLSVLPAASPAGAQRRAPLLVSQRGETVPDAYIVVFKDGAAAQGSRAGASPLHAAVAAAGGTVGRRYGAALNGFSAHLPQAALARVLDDPEVAYVEADAVVRLDPQAAGAVPQAAQPGAPWALDRVDQRALPLNGAYGYARTGTGTHVYVVDTGVLATHDEFGGRATRDFDAVDDGNDGVDCNGHGTHVSGIVGGTTWGIAKNARLHGVRVLDCAGAGTTSSVIAGLDWVAGNHLHPAVVNLSLGGPASAALDEAVGRLVAAGVPVVAAAGNAGTDACDVSPARAPAAITVGATGPDDFRADFSNFGSCLDLFAPGVGVTSAWHTGGGALETLSGTSMAAPFVAGAAALYLEGRPAADPAAVRKAVVNSASVGRVGDEAGSPDRLLYAPFGTPSPNLPTGRGTDTTPAFSWGRAYGATGYRIEVSHAGAVVYARLAGADACGQAECTLTPAKRLPVGGYSWRVQALVRGAWRDWSHRLSFTVARP